MCLIAFAWQQVPNTPLILTGNRDEFFARPTQSAHWWEDNPNIFAGKDKKAGGTWLGINKEGKIAALTNFRRPDTQSYLISRGHLIRDFLASNLTAEAFSSELRSQQNEYAGFNLLLYDGAHLICHSNRDDADPQPLPPGIYGLSNHLLDTPWPKVEKVKSGLQQLINNGDTHTETPYMTLFADSRKAADNRLPETGMGPEIEKELSSVFIRGKHYGTRATTWLSLSSEGDIKLVEQNHLATGPGEKVDLSFKIKSSG